MFLDFTSCLSDFKFLFYLKDGPILGKTCFAILFLMSLTKRLKKKKLDELSSNINITCDMLVQIVRNLVILSNTSSNVSAEAVKSLLVENESSNKIDKTDISIDLDQYKYHLYHPLYLNQNLNQYSTKSIPLDHPSVSTSKNLPK